MSFQVVHSDCLTYTRFFMADNEIDSIVTDPPYHLTSIVKRFGKPGSAPVKINNIYGPGGSPFVRGAKGFMGKEWDGGDIAFRPETWAEMLRVLKPGGHMLAFGGTRTYHRMACAIEDAGFEIRDSIMWLYGSGFPKSHNQKDEWEGWGTALKPAFEPIILARKPLEGSVRENLDKWGIGALNIQDSRAGDRWPANIIHDGSNEVVSSFPDSKGQQGDVKGTESSHTGDENTSCYGEFGRVPFAKRNDSGSAARFFYCAKASKSDREEGCENLPKKQGGQRSETSGQHITRRDGGAPGFVANNHPTVKPTALMRYLCRLITPPDGLIFDPFTGSGSTGKAALLEGFRFIGTEKDTDYISIANARIAAATPQKARAFL